MPSRTLKQKQPAGKKNEEKGPRKKARSGGVMDLELKKQTDFVETILNASVDLIAVYDKETRLIAMNKQCELIYKVDKEEWIGKTFLEIFPDAKDSQSYSDLLAALQGEKIHNLTFTSSDVPKHYENFLLPLKHDDGEVYAVLVMAHDNTAIIDATKELQQTNTELKQVNEQLRRSEERYYRMTNEVEDYTIILMSNEGIIENWNRGAEKIKGYRADEIVGKHFSIFYSPEDQKKNLPKKLLEKASHDGKAAFEGWRVRKDGTSFWGSTVITALHDSNNKIIGFSKVTRDLTERKIAEDKLQMYADELLQKNKELERSNSELSSFSYVASHDLQEPLRKIQGFGNLILNSEISKLSETGKDYFNRMIKAASRMQNLIDSLLEFSRTTTEARNFEEVDLNELLEEVKKDMRERIESSGAVIQSQKLPALSVIPFQFRQLLSNLVSNALKYARKDVKPVINILAKCIPAEEINDPHAVASVNYYQFIIRDNGIGFEEEYGEKIFELFQRLHGKNEYGGSGIGLAICKKIVENHSGWIKAESEPGAGSSFIFYIPVREIMTI
jgi:PAS domain S-box-containing protein